MSSTTKQSGVSPVRAEAASLVALAEQARYLPLQAANIHASEGGHYVSAFKGRGMEFDEVRPYQAGDDIRSIDWKVTARTGKTHTKLYREERERPVLLAVDLSRSMFFATRGAYKAVVATRVASLLAWSACFHGDRLGGLLFNEQGHQEIRPRRGKNAVIYLIKALCSEAWWRNDNNTTPNAEMLPQALLRMRRVAKPGSLVILCSDFNGFDQSLALQLGLLAQHCDVILTHISDPLERELPKNGYYRFSDNQQEIAVTITRSLRSDYQQVFQQQQQAIEEACRKHHIHYLPLSTHDALVTRLQNGLGLMRRR